MKKGSMGAKSLGFNSKLFANLVLELFSNSTRRCSAPLRAMLVKSSSPVLGFG